MTPTQLQEGLTRRGWKKDHWGHMRKTIHIKLEHGTAIREHRIKFQVNTVRWEVKGDMSGMWIRITGDYYKNIVLLEDGRLKVGSKIFKALNT